VAETWYWSGFKLNRKEIVMSEPAREMKHQAIMNRIEAIDRAVGRLNGLVSKVQGTKVAEVGLDDDEQPEQPLQEFLIQTPDVLGELADRIEKSTQTLEELLF